MSRGLRLSSGVSDRSRRLRLVQLRIALDDLCPGSWLPLCDAKIVVDRNPVLLLGAQISFRRLNRAMPQQELDLLKIATRFAAEFRASSTEIVRSKLLNPDLLRSLINDLVSFNKDCIGTQLTTDERENGVPVRHPAIQPLSYFDSGFSRCPPNSYRNADSSLFENSASPRELNRS